MSGIKQLERLTPGRFGLGTRWRETREVFGHFDTQEMEVIACERDRTYTLSHDKACVRVEIVFSFEPVPAGTRVTITFTLDGARRGNGLRRPAGLWARNPFMASVVDLAPVGIVILGNRATLGSRQTVTLQ